MVPALAGLLLLLMLGVTGSALMLFREATAIHPVLGWTVLAVLVVGFALLIVLPVARVMTLPRGLAVPAETSGPRWERYLRRFARRLLRNRELDGFARLDELEALTRSRKYAELEATIRQAMGFLDERARCEISRQAGVVFATTAISQSGRLDSVVVLSAQLRLVRRVAEIYSARPSLRELARLYANVGGSAFLAGEIQDSELLAVLGAPVSAAIVGMVPVGGTDPAVSLLVTGLMDGSANGFLTLRVGIVTMRYCDLGPPPDRRRVASSTSIEAAGLLAATIGEGASRVATTTRRLLLQGAISGTAKAARGVADVGSGAIGKLAEVLDRAARQVGRQASRPPRWMLQESFRFWQGIAGSFAALADDSGGEGRDGHEAEGGEQPPGSSNTPEAVRRTS